MPSPAQIINIDITNDPNRNAETAGRSELSNPCDEQWLGRHRRFPGVPRGYAPFQFVAGTDNPIPGLANSDVMVSDSLVTVPVFDTTGLAADQLPRYRS